ncbi:RING-CH-type domain-containing protein [Trichostrongylus colubriformis]|uniref:RING-CH-type domain-containing protein n=1 Tax=Trichostrongylus colubriformis TaxID=6319 RepID=A0AAN8INV3_TRICO
MPVLSSPMNNSLGPAVCRVCLSSESSIPYLGNSAGEPLISPCHCKGTMGLYHRSCLEHWLSTSRTYCCEICKFRYEIGRRKRGFMAYLRAHSWFIDGDHARSVGSDFACLIILTPLTIGGSVLCIQSINERLQVVDEKGDFENAHEILGLGFMAFFLILVFVFWIFFVVLFYVHDYHVWQKKNMILYVIDQLDRENETYSRTHTQFSESQRPLLLGKNIRKFLCCGGHSREHTIIPLRDTAIHPLVVQNIEGGVHNQLRIISPIASTASSSQQTSTGALPITVSLTSASPLSELRGNSATNNSLAPQTSSPVHVPALSTFRPYVTPSSARIFPYTSTPRLLLPMLAVEQPPNVCDGAGNSAADVEPTTSAASRADCLQPLGLSGSVASYF